MSSASVGSRSITSLNVVRPIAGSVIPAVECSAISIFVSNSRSNAHAQLRAPAPPVSIRVPSMSNRISFAWLIRPFSYLEGRQVVATGRQGGQRDSRGYNKLVVGGNKGRQEATNATRQTFVRSRRRWEIVACASIV